MRSQFSSKRRERNGKTGATAGNVKGKNSQGGETGTDLQTEGKTLERNSPQQWSSVMAAHRTAVHGQNQNLSLCLQS